MERTRWGVASRLVVVEARVSSKIFCFSCRGSAGCKSAVSRHVNTRHARTSSNKRQATNAKVEAHITIGSNVCNRSHECHHLHVPSTVDVEYLPLVTSKTTQVMMIRDKKTWLQVLLPTPRIPVIPEICSTDREKFGHMC